MHGISQLLGAAKLQSAPGADNPRYAAGSAVIPSGSQVPHIRPLADTAHCKGLYLLTLLTNVSPKAFCSPAVTHDRNLSPLVVDLASYSRGETCEHCVMLPFQ